MIKGAKYIIETFNKNGFQAYLVGGCVRDMIMGNTPDDYDITTDALPSQIVKLFERTILTGEKHGTVTVRINSQNYEVTTFRIDGEYINNRKPKEVIFTNKLKEDTILQKYYSVNFDTWFDGLVESYEKLNGALCDVQDKLIIDHEFITGVRVLTEEEYQQALADKLRAEESETTAPDTESETVDSETEADVTTSTDETANDTTAADETTADGESSDETTLPEEDVTTDGIPDDPAEDVPEKEEEDKLTPEEQIALENVVDNGKIVKVTYEGGKVFILNYNNFKVSVDGQEIEALSFITLTEGGEG